MSANFSSVIIYFSIAIIPACGMYYLEKRKPEQILNYLLVLLIVISVFSGLRARTVGWDTENYYSIIGYTIDSGYNRYPLEPGLFYLTVIISRWIPSINFVLFVIAFIINGLIFITIWKFRNFLNLSSTLFMYFTSFFILTLSGLRQWIGISIILFGVTYLLDKKYFTFIVYVLLATLFHNSALISLCILPIFLIIDNKNKIFDFIKNLTIYHAIFAVLILIVISYSFLKIPLINKYAHYLMVLTRGGSGLFVYIKLSIYLLLLYYIYNQEIVIRDKEVNTFVAIANTGFFISIPGYFFRNIGRIAWYYSIFEIFLVGALVKQNDKKSCFISLLFILVSLILFTLDIMFDGRGVVPYRVLK